MNVFGQPLGPLDNVSPTGKNGNFKVGHSFQVTVDTYDDPNNTIVEQRILGKFRHVVDGSAIYEIRPDNRPLVSQFVAPPNPPTEAEWMSYDIFAQAKGGDDKFLKELAIENGKAMRTDRTPSVDISETHLKVSKNRIQYVDLPGKPGSLGTKPKHIFDFKPVTGTFDMNLLVNVRAYHVSERSILPAKRKTQLEQSVFIDVYADSVTPGTPSQIRPEHSGTIGFGKTVSR